MVSGVGPVSWIEQLLAAGTSQPGKYSAFGQSLILKLRCSGDTCGLLGPSDNRRFSSSVRQRMTGSAGANDCATFRWFVGRRNVPSAEMGKRRDNCNFLVERLPARILGSAFETIDYSSLSFKSLSPNATVRLEHAPDGSLNLRVTVESVGASIGASSSVKIYAQGRLTNGEQFTEDLVLTVQNPRAWSVKPSTLLFRWDEVRGKWLGRFFCFSPKTRPVSSGKFEAFKVEFNSGEVVVGELVELESKPFGLAGAIAVDRPFRAATGRELKVVVPGGKTLGLAAKFDLSSKETGK